ncbi:MAG: bifunctional DNA primase/polymerase, partial [Desulfatibacillaceae bacterium]|nr:bifunctional DNA primase/polymerase [Desulfatibacillaceae bacterium]
MMLNAPQNNDTRQGGLAGHEESKAPGGAAICKNHTTDGDLCQAALDYARRGWAVFPCNGKAPLTPHGFKDASTDPAQIQVWWQKWPDANIGAATGPASGVWVLDLDLPHGPESWQALQEQHGQAPETLTAQSGGGGLHYFFRWNDTARIQSKPQKTLGAGIDTKGQGGYIILPPSSHKSGGHYHWLNNAPIVVAPQWLIDLLLNKVPAPQAPAPQNPATAAP